ncbi:putative late blight resistance protein homolog R1B-16 [Coffea eugenioides]|uniref:putative late blight resistance protein homolog R1B-16 n=1 Tax=Coffea eugenioides TaxID=49369 RepID=UPI000F60CBB5|nr:putative late blight resistance protein homolog R1B-16 [Coffea eugenioides]
MEMASTCSIDRVFLDLELLLNSSRDRHVPFDAIKHMQFLKTFLMCARKWSQSNDLYLESDNVVKKVSLPSFLSCIEDTFHEYEKDIHSLSHRSETDKQEIENYTIGSYYSMFRELEKQIKSLKQEIIKIYFALASNRSFQSNSCMTDDELMEFIDLILQNLADLTNGYMAICKISESYISAALTLSAQVQALEAKLTFLKSFIPFAKMRGTADIPALLLSHFEVVALKAARLSYMCFFWDDAEAMHNPELYSMVYEQQQKIRAVDFHVYEIYKEVLGASNSSTSLHTAEMDEQILNNFNDSLISCLWELLCYSSSFMDSVKDEMHILYAGLRFLRRILRKHQEKMDEQNEKIGALLSEAGIIICSLSLNRVQGEEVGFSESTEALDCIHMLANTNIHIKHFKDQISGSSIIGSHPNPSHSLTVQEVCKPLKHMPSKGKVPITHEDMVDLDDEVEKLIERLVSGPEQVEIVPIVGMAGLGKTTLAKKVYNHRSVIYNFHIRLWCTVSQEFNMKSLLIQILCPDGKQSNMDEELKNFNEHELLQQLYQRLKTKRYLVVFDDVWDFRAWNELRYSFPNDKNRSRILFTSRFSNVASQVQYAGKPHNLRPLSEKESFELLLKKVFGKEDCPQALHGIGMEIAKKCMGLPLAVVVVAGVLATIEHDILVWEEFARSLTSTMVSSADQCKKSLELSYEHLPYHLKDCLLYFASFREDEKIGAKKLMRLWIAEGFVEKIEGKRSEDIAEEYLMDLIGRNLVMVSKSRSIGGVKTCYIHDLIFEFCKAEAKEKKFLQVLRGYDELSTFNEPPFLHRLSICSSGEDFIKARLFCPHLSSLLLFGQQVQLYEFELLNISSLFCIYKHLEVLNLQCINLMLKELPTEVESLLSLRYLALTSWNLTLVPPCIAKLSNLETFHLISGRRVSLPDSIWNMKKLVHVNVKDSIVIRLSSNDNVLENLSTLPNLGTFSGLLLSSDQEAENILRRIPNIRGLKINLIGNRVCCNMSHLECLESLTLNLIHFSGPSDHVELSLPMNLKKLCLAWMDLACSQMSLIEQLPNLEVFKLEQVWLKRWKLMEGGFPKLRVLTLVGVKVAEWTETDSDSDDYFPCLQQLKLRRIFYLEMMPSCLERISTLQTIIVLYCGDGVESLAREIEAAQKNYGNENLEIIMENSGIGFY